MSIRTSESALRSAVLELLPPQGRWNEDEYLWLTDHTIRPFELTDGYIEPLPMPTDEHQGISGFLYLALTLYLQSRGGGSALFTAPPAPAAGKIPRAQPVGPA